MGFKANQAEAEQGFQIKPEGDYECIIASVEERTTRNGATGLNFSLVIRNDVEQKFKNSYIFDTLWKRKQPTPADQSVNGYGFGQVMAYGKAAQLPDGKDYENLEQFIQDLINKPIRVTLKHGEYNGQPQENVSFKNITKFPQVKHVMKLKTNVTSDTYATPATATKTQPELPIDDDLPF